jgi:hypothetical protein
MTPEQKNDRRFRLYCTIPILLLTWTTYTVVAAQNPKILITNQFAPLITLSVSVAFSFFIVMLLVDTPPIKKRREQIAGHRLLEPENPSDKKSTIPLIYSSAVSQSYSP